MILAKTDWAETHQFERGTAPPFRAFGFRSMNDQSRKKIRARVNRINGQINGIGKMIDDDRYCIEILDQIAAARSALDSLGVELLASHLETCVLGHKDEAHNCAKPHTSEELVEELRATLSRFLK